MISSFAPGWKRLGALSYGLDKGLGFWYSQAMNPLLKAKTAKMELLSRCRDLAAVQICLGPQGLYLEATRSMPEQVLPAQVQGVPVISVESESLY